VRVVIAEDLAVLREGIASLLRTGATRWPDLAIVDVRV
jgi:hypothetical protein